jgi:O-methyltransferase
MLASFTDNARRLLHRLGLTAPPVDLRAALPFWCDDMARVQAAIYQRVKPYTMTGPERVAALCQSIAHLEQHRLPGAIVECGVWRGGSMMAAALALLYYENTRRQLFLFDTFAGMPAPSSHDRDLNGRAASEWIDDPADAAEMVRASCALGPVRDAMGLTRYPWEKIIFVAGRVEHTLPEAAPREIALLRLDTDWYESTLHELETLYPRLADGGILIVDDYGHWQGARKAVDEYFARRGASVPMHAIDYTGRLVVKKSRAEALAA